MVRGGDLATVGEGEDCIGEPGWVLQLKGYTSTRLEYPKGVSTPRGYS